MPKHHPHPTAKLLLASALTLALHSTLHAATDIEAPTPGTGQDASASATSSDPANTITATAASGAPNSNGGNATATATLTPTSDTISTLSATGGNGGDATFLTSIAGNGGNATITPLTLSTTTANITLTASAKGGNGGNDTLSNTLAGNGGNASLNTITLSSLSGNITATATQTSGNGGTGATSPFNGSAPDSSLTNIFSPSTTGNITLTQSAIAGNGSSGGNATSSLTLTNTTAASLTATVSATAGSHGSGTAYINLAAASNISATSVASSGIGLASATAIVTPQTTTNFFGSATATTKSTGTASAMAYGSNAFFPSYHSYASGTAVPGIQTAWALASQTFVPYTFPGGISTPPQAFAYPYFNSFNINNGTTSTRVNDQLLKGDFVAKNSSAPGTQVHTTGFEGMLDTSLFIPEDLIIVTSNGPPLLIGGATYDSLRFRIWADGNLELDITTHNSSEFSKLLGSKTFDFGPLDSFGPGPLDLQAQMDLTTHIVGDGGDITFSVFNRDPSLLPTPEPASLSLLTAATLPLLLKRRRKI